MEVTVLKTPGPYCFLGNPVVFELQTAAYGAIDVSVSRNGETFTQSYYPFLKNGVYSCKVDISGFLFRTELADSFPQGAGILSEFPDHSVAYIFTISDAVLDEVLGYSDYTFAGNAFPGGVNEQALALFAKNGVNLFSARLSNQYRNFLFTTRTHRSEIRVKLSELYPFLTAMTGWQLRFVSTGGNTIVQDPVTAAPCCLLDFYMAYDRFISEFKEFTKTIDVYVGDNTEKAFRLVIDSKSDSEEVYKIRFRNSLGAFEVIEVAGVASHEPELGDETSYKELTDYNFYENRRNRVVLIETIKVETGYKSKDDLLFIRDLVGSDEAYFYYPDGTFFRCSVKADKMAYRQKKVTPTSVALVVTEVGTGKYISPELDRNALDVLGIYNETFDQTFNETFN